MIKLFWSHLQPQTDLFVMQISFKKMEKRPCIETLSTFKQTCEKLASRIYIFLLFELNKQKAHPLTFSLKSI